MQIKKCDICRKKIKFGEYMNIHAGFDHHEICNKCAQPISKFLKAKKLMSVVKKL